MRFLPNRLINLPSSTEQVYSEWLHSIDSELENQDCDRYELCRRILTDIHYPTLTNKKPQDLSLSDKVLIANLDPRNVTLEPEDKTLSDNDIEEVSKKIISTVQETTGATLRS